ncbi:hypothetical protein [Natronomonas sp. EA1]|uniref:hypothetical protein n=1 Tax=Natronomonas sp. EA1 TaxID=3421655 RepID=UPI003EBB72EE
MSESSPPAAHDVPSKTTLFCPSCGHQSRCDGDWTRIESVHETRLSCPDCGETILTRPTTVDDRQSTPLWRQAWETWDAGLQAWQAVWRRMVATY